MMKRIFILILWMTLLCSGSAFGEPISPAGRILPPISESPQAGAIPRADANATINAWLTSYYNATEANAIYLNESSNGADIPNATAFRGNIDVYSKSETNGTVESLSLNATEANVTYEVQLNNEAGLYAVLSDVSDFVQTSETSAWDKNASADVVNSTDLGDTADLLYEAELDSESKLETQLADVSDVYIDGEEDTIAGMISEGALTNSSVVTSDIKNGTITEPDLSADIVATDEDYLQYDSTGTNFTWRSPAEVLSDISGSANDFNATGDVTITASGISDLSANTDITADLEEESHSSEHESGGADEIDVSGLTGADDDDVTDDNVESMATAGGAGTAPLSDGASGLSMADVWTESENTAAGYMQKAENLSDVSNATTARTNIGVAIGSDVQAYNANMDTNNTDDVTESDFTAANDVLVGTGASTYSAVDSSNWDKNSTNDVEAGDFTQDSGFLVGTGAGTYQEETGATARTSLGLGAAATKGTSTVSNGDTSNVPTGDNVFDFTETTQDYLKTSENDDTADDITDNTVDELLEGTGLDPDFLTGDSSDDDKVDTAILTSDVVLESDVDDAPVNGTTTDPISSNWAYDHANDADQHSEYMQKADNLSDVSNATTAFSNIKQDATTSATGVVELATDAEAANSTVTDRAVTPSQLVSATTGYQGLQWNESTDSYTRTGTISWADEGSSPGDSHLPVHDSMRPCVINTDAEVQYYLDESNCTLKADGGAAVLDGTDGQVVVEIPKFYYDYDYGSNTHDWKVGPAPFPGSSVHPAFTGEDGTVYEHIYIGRYEGVAYDDSTSAYVNATGTAASNFAGGSMNSTHDYLGSVSGFIPLSDETRPEFRTLAENNDGHLESIHDTMAYRLLFIIEYADLNWQDAVGAGKTNNNSNYAYVAATGESDGVGATGSQEASSGTSTDGYFVYRHIENPFGNFWKWIDAINVNNDGSSSKCYVATVNDATTFADNTTTDYTYVGDLAESDDYVDTLVQTSLGILPATVGGGAASSTKVGDKYWTYYNNNANVGWRGVLLGGSLYTGVRAGGFGWLSLHPASYDFWIIGGRVVFHPSE